MIPNPLHPAVVHFPIVLVILLPLSVIAAIWRIRRGTLPRRAWPLPLVIAAFVMASTFVALKTGETEEDRVEAVVSEAVIHTHEEAAERMLVLSGVVLLIAAVGLARGVLGTSARFLTAAGSIALVLTAVQVGAAGGELVYRHNAASVYTDNPGGTQPGAEADDD